MQSGFGGLSFSRHFTIHWLIVNMHPGSRRVNAGPKLVLSAHLTSVH